MIDDIQDEDLAKADLRRHEQLCEMRSPWEDTFREVDERFPSGAGGFNGETPGQVRGQRNVDTTHITAIGRFRAAMQALTTPEQSEYIKVKFLDENLMNAHAVKEWCAYAGRRMRDIRHAVHTGFGIATAEDWDQLGRYGTSLVWQEPRHDKRGLFYRALHLSTCWIDVNFAGMIDTVQRKWEASVRELEQQFGREALTPKMLDVLTDADASKADRTKFEILHTVCPNTDWDKDKLDHRRFPISSRYLAVGEKLFLRRKGYNTMPISGSRHMTSPNEIYGRSPAINQLPTIGGINAMRRTGLRALHKAVDPALLFNKDNGVTKLVTRPGGPNPGMMDDNGRPMVARMPGGEGALPQLREDIQDERNVVRTEFLEEFYSILSNPNSRMTTVEVYERMAKEGVLVRPYADRYAAEKQDPMTQRDLDMALRAGQLKQPPPEVLEAGAWPVVYYENPLATLARAESAGKTLRALQALPILAEIEPKVRHRVDADAMTKGIFEDMGVPAQYLRSDEEVRERSEAEDQQQAAAVDAELLESTGAAVKDLATADKIQRQAPV